VLDFDFQDLVIYFGINAKKTFGESMLKEFCSLHNVFSRFQLKFPQYSA